MDFDLELCVNDEHTGAFLGLCDGLTVRVPGDADELLTLSALGQGEPWVVRFEGPLLYVGSLRLRHHSHGTHVGNLCWNVVSLSVYELAGLLAALQGHPAWVYECGSEPVADAWLGETMDFLEWLAVLRAVAHATAKESP